MTNGDHKVFVDTNVLVYAAMKEDVRHAASMAVLQDANSGALCVSPQSLTEFYSTITSSKRVSAPLTPAEAIGFIETLIGCEQVTVLPISRPVSERWLSLLRTEGVRGPHVFDIQIAATMLEHGVSKLFTYNGRDFHGLPGIEAMEPDSVPP